MLDRKKFLLGISVTAIASMFFPKLLKGFTKSKPKIKLHSLAITRKTKVS